MPGAALPHRLSSPMCSAGRGKGLVPSRGAGLAQGWGDLGDLWVCAVWWSGKQ